MDAETALAAYEWLSYYYITAVVLAIIIGMVLERKWSIGKTLLYWGLLIVVPSLPLYLLIGTTFVGLNQILIWWAFLPVLGVLGSYFLYKGEKAYNIQISLYGSIMVMVWCGIFCIAVWQVLRWSGETWSRPVFVIVSAIIGVILVFYVKYKYVPILKEYVGLNQEHKPPYMGLIILITLCTTVCHVAWFYISESGLYFTIITLAVVTLLTSITSFIFIGLSNMTEIVRSDSELETARKLQQSVLPDTNAMDWKFGFDAVALMEPAKEIGGDFYDIFKVDDRKVAFVIGDVSDKGIPSALFMMRSRSTIREKLLAKSDVGEAVSLANEALMEDNPTSMFVTSFVSVLDLDTGELSYVNAGHIPPILITGSESNCIEGNKAPFLGMRSYTYATNSIILNEGDIVTLFTDGFTEAESNGKFYGIERALNVTTNCKNPEEVVSTLKNDVSSFANVNDNQDDMAILSFSFLKTVHLELMPEEDSLDEMISLVENVSKELPSELSLRAQMVTEEILVNIIDYGDSTKFSLTVRKDSGLTLVVTDNSKKFNPLKAKIRDKKTVLEDRLGGGEGIRIIRTMSDGVSYGFDHGHNVLKIRFDSREDTE